MNNTVCSEVSKTPLLIKRIDSPSSRELADISRALKAQTEEQAVKCINWPKFPYCPDVGFRIGHVQDEIWLSFRVAEKSVRGLETKTHGSVYKDSCVEFFVSFDRMNFYNLEVNCIGTVHLGYGPSRSERKFVPLQNIELIEVLSSLGDQPFAEKGTGVTWDITLRIPVKVFAFDELGSLSGKVATANFFKIGDELAVPHYVSWAPISAPVPDYHRPDSFRSIRFS